MLGRWLRRNPHEAAGRELYLQVVAQARRPEFYEYCAVPDSVDGRFELVALHVFLVLHRLKRDHPRGADLAQALFDTMFVDMDQSLRELGAGDLGVGRRVKDMAKGLYGRIAAYEAGLGDLDGGLEAALARNLYGTVEIDSASLRRMCVYVRREAAGLTTQGLAALTAGRVVFGDPPGAE